VSWKLDTILARRCPEGCYRLEDPKGGLVGCAPRASNLERFAAAVGARVRVCEEEETRRGLLGWLSARRRRGE
jgi:hypothetical protein